MPVRSPAMPVRALRGATTVDADVADHIVERVKVLVHELFERNALDVDAVISIVVTGTPDIRAIHPATAVRAYGLPEVALLGAQELDVDGALERCIRLLVHVDTDRPRTELQHVFLERAVELRPDLVDGG